MYVLFSPIILMFKLNFSFEKENHLDLFKIRDKVSCTIKLSRSIQTLWSCCIYSCTLWTYLFFICCGDMTEVFTSLPEQDILFAEFFLEEFLWKHRAQEFLYDLKLLITFSTLQYWPVVKKEITGCNVVNKIAASVGTGWCRRAHLCVLREGEKGGGSETPELNAKPPEGVVD